MTIDGSVKLQRSTVPAAQRCPGLHGILPIWYEYCDIRYESLLYGYKTQTYPVHQRRMLPMLLPKMARDQLSRLLLRHSRARCTALQTSLPQSKLSVQHFHSAVQVPTTEGNVQRRAAIIRAISSYLSKIRISCKLHPEALTATIYIFRLLRIDYSSRRFTAPIRTYRYLRLSELATD